MSGLRLYSMAREEGRGQGWKAILLPVRHAIISLCGCQADARQTREFSEKYETLTKAWF